MFEWLKKRVVNEDWELIDKKIYNEYLTNNDWDFKRREVTHRDSNFNGQMNKDWDFRWQKV